MSFGPKSSVFQQTDSRQVNDLQRATGRILRQMQTLLPLTGVYVTTIPDSNGIQVPIEFVQNVPVYIPHNLGYPYTGWLVGALKYVSGGTAAPFIVEYSSVSVSNTDTDESKSSRIVLVNLAAPTVTAHVWVY